MTDTFVVVEPDNALTVAVTENTFVVSSSNLSNPAVVESIDFISDVDVSTNGKLNGSVLVYKTTTNKWTSTTTLDAQNMEGGEF
jgi:HKD family nuclease